MSKIKFSSLAAAVAAMAFIFSCSDDKDEGGGTSSNSNISTCGGNEYDTTVYSCKDGELVGSCRGESYYPEYEYCDNGVIKDLSSSSDGGSSSSEGGGSSSSDYGYESSSSDGDGSSSSDGGDSSSSDGDGSSSSDGGESSSSDGSGSSSSVGGGSSSSDGSGSSSGGISSSFGGISSGSGNCPSPSSNNAFVDQRDCKEYKFEAAPNGRIWMSENLNYSRNNTLGYCYGVDINGASPHQDASGCDNGYGRVYEYSTAIDGNSPQGLCPVGWHIPSTTEWCSIANSNVSNVCSGTPGEMPSGFYIFAGNYNPTYYCRDYNSTFSSTCFPVGWKEQGESGFHWTSSGNSYFAGFWNIDNSPYKTIETGATSLDYFSVRCIADDNLTLNCNGTPYSPTAKFCSGGKVYDRCDGKEYNPSTHFCSDKLYSKCGDREYNPAEEYCKGGNITPASEPCEVNFDYSSTGGTRGFQIESCMYITNEQNCPNNLKLYNYNFSFGTWAGTIYCEEDLIPKAINCDKYGECVSDACPPNTKGAFLRITSITGTGGDLKAECW